MALSKDDQAFIRERVAVAWANHFVMVSSLLSTGASPRKLGRHIVRRLNLNRNFLGLPRQRLTPDLGVRVQAVAALRIWQEFAAALENAGAFLRAIAERDDGGVLWHNFSYRTEEIREFFRCAKRRAGGIDVLGLPPMSVLERRCEKKFVARAAKLYPWIDKRLREAATVYLKRRLLPVVAIRAASRHGDPRGLVYVFVDVPRPPAPGKRGREKRGLLEEAMNKVKHGFNATTAQPIFVESGAGRRLRAIPLSRSNEIVQTLGRSIDAAGSLVLSVGQLVLDLDRAGLM